MSSCADTPFEVKKTYKLFCRGWGKQSNPCGKQSNPCGKGDLPGFQPCRGLWTFLKCDETYCEFEQYESPQNTWAIPHTMLNYYKAVPTTTDTPELHPDSLEPVQ